ncbi:MAG: thioredoxin domain-containing protein [bacterium]|nr:thioredoxin domain-containing protein [bacterium]
MDDQEQPLTKKQRRDLKKQEKIENKNQEKSKKIRTQILVWLGVIVIIGAGIYGIMQIDSDGNNTTTQVYTINETDNTKGNADASLVLIEYSDFQCPACATYQSMVKQLMEEYNDQIYFAYRHFPLRSIHDNAQLAGQAAEAAGLQGKFWEMHDKLFENQSDWSNESDPTEKFATYAGEFELDVEKFKTDLTSDIAKDKVNSDYNSGTAAKVNSTPSFFLNGDKISNPKTYEDFKELIDNELGNITNTTE